MLNQFKSPLIYILLIAAVVTFFLAEYIDTGVIMAVVVLNAVIGYVQEYKAEESMKALKKMVMPRAKVIRGGAEKEINSEELVPGDIVLISSGAKIPADLRLFSTVELRVDEAALTGESLPVEKATVTLDEKNLSPGDQINTAFTGTIVVSGRGKGVVVETGHRTVLGQIAETVRDVRAVKTPLQQRLEKFARIVGIVVIGFSVVVFAAGVSRGEAASDIFVTAVAIAVSAIPEGLPIAVTIAMAIGVGRMSRRNAIVRKLPAVETLGSTTVICSDKTGTLTKNEMTVKLVYDGQHVYDVKGTGYEPRGEILLNRIPTLKQKGLNLEAVLRIGLLCNESNLYEEDGSYKVEGDPTEGALIVSAIKGGLDTVEEKKEYPQLAVLPFESERGFMATLHSHQGGKLVFVKGAPEKILDMCTQCNIDGALQSKHIVETAQQFAKEGLRVLAMAYKKIPADVEEITHQEVKADLIFAGLQGMIDPPRPEAVKAIEESRKAGIRTVMVTGDHAVTAVVIAKKLGIVGGEAEVIEGRDIESMSREELFQKVKTVSVFARVSPHHKLLIVEQFLKHGEVVAVTGDGVNDAPALKIAHIGVAMGRTGTDVSKEASDMVLTDDNFATIFAAVVEGRVVYDNIKKVTYFLIATGFAELLAILGSIILGLPIPYLPAQILWLNLVTNGLQDVALAFEPAENDVLTRKPRNPKEGILTRLMLERTILTGVILAVGTLFVFQERLSAGVPLERARTAALTTMVFFQFYQALNSRSETQSVFSMNPLKNPFLFVSMVAAFFAHMAVLYVPPMQFIFRTEPLSATVWVQILLITTTVLGAVEMDKWIRRRKQPKVTTPA